MVQYPNCPFCDNESSALSIVDVEIDGVMLKSIQCNNCKKYLGFYKDDSKEIEGINEKLDRLESDIEDAQSIVDRYSH